MNGSFTSAAPPSGPFRSVDRCAANHALRSFSLVRWRHPLGLLAALASAGMACAHLFPLEPHVARPLGAVAAEDTAGGPGPVQAGMGQVFPTEPREDSEDAALLPGAPAPDDADSEAASAGAAEQPSWALAARSTPPGQTWQDAANAGDWPSVAQLIDALPDTERGTPGVRYARAVAARELGQYDVALAALANLESELPLLHEEIKSTRAHCQLEIGPYEEAYQYFTREQSPENLILAAQACLNGTDFARAQQTIDRAFQKIKKQGDSRRGRRNEIAARSLRARIASAGGKEKLAARDYLWLATEAPTDAAARGAAEAYERASGKKLTKPQRLARLQSFGREGMLEQALAEERRLAEAPGATPDSVEITAALAWAHYYSRRDYARAAELFQKAAEQSRDNRARHLFFAARARSRANQDDQAIADYQRLLAQYPSSGYTEQTYYRIAHLLYGLGRWEKAEKAYSEYLDRFAKSGGGRYASASRYELAIARLGAKQRTEEAASTLGQLARRERRAERRAVLMHLEGVALELTQEPKKVEEAIARYQAVIDSLPLSFAAMASAARLRALGIADAHRARLDGELGAVPLANAMRLELPEKARFLAAIGLHTDAERALFDQRAEIRRRYAEDDARALCALYGSLDRGYRSYALADRLLRSENLGRPPSAENLWAWRCAYPKPYREVVDAVEARYGLPPHLVHAVMRQESGFRPNVVSPAGAVGLMQLMPYTARRAAEEITEQPGAPWVPDPNRVTNILNNVELGGYYLSKLLGMLRGQLPAVVAAYNAGPKAVSRWLAGGEDLPVDVWVARIPYTETRDYVAIVLGNWLAYRYLDTPSELPELSLAMIPGTRATPDAY